MSDKLARAANLLRTRVDIELEQQNSELLKAMNERTRLQLRLQQTVEGLSIAAISYYVVSLLDYAIEPLPLEALGLPPKLVKAHAGHRYGGGYRLDRFVLTPPEQGINWTAPA